MKWLVLICLLAGCSDIQVQTTDPITGAAEVITIKTPRRIAISTSKVTVVAGQVLINDETVQILAKTAVGQNEQD